MIILEDNAMSNQSKAKNPIRKSKLAGGIYVIPQDYSVLLEQLRSGKIGSELDASGEIIEKPLEASALEKQNSENSESSDSQKDLRRRFWGRAGAIARQRIKSKLPDLSTAEARVARLHESLWVEELRMTLELQGLRSCVDEIKPLGNGLFILDISEMFDEISYSLAQFLQRGFQVQVSSNDGQTCLAFVQPGSDSGKLILSSTESIEYMRGPYDIEFLPNRFPQRAMHRALDCERVKEVLTEVQGVADVETGDTGDTTGPSGPRPNGPNGGQAEVVLPPSLNSVQRRALATAIESRNRFPLLVWGPPGTGKSTLAAFLVWHLVQESSQFQILVTAPSNTGADVLCAKLAKLGLDHSRMLRLNALGRNVKNSTRRDPMLWEYYTERWKNGFSNSTIVKIAYLQGDCDDLHLCFSHCKYSEKGRSSPDGLHMQLLMKLEKLLNQRRWFQYSSCLILVLQTPLRSFCLGTIFSWVLW